MDSVSSIASGLQATSGATGAIATSVLNQVSNLEKDQVDRLFASFGQGLNVSSSA